MNLESINRATPEGFLIYMTANPVYFQDLFNIKATESNIIHTFYWLQDNCLVAAKHPPVGFNNSLY